MRLRFKGCLQQAPALSFRNKFTTPKRPCLLRHGGVRRAGFSMVGPTALQSQRLVGKSEGDKVVLHAGGRAGLAWGQQGLLTGTPCGGSQDRLTAYTLLNRPLPALPGLLHFLVKFKLPHLDSENRGSGQGKIEVASLPPDPLRGFLGLRAMQAWQMPLVMQMAARSPKQSIPRRSGGRAGAH